MQQQRIFWSATCTLLPWQPSWTSAATTTTAVTTTNSCHKQFTAINKAMTSESWSPTPSHLLTRTWIPFVQLWWPKGGTWSTTKFWQTRLGAVTGTATPVTIIIQHLVTPTQETKPRLLLTRRASNKIVFCWKKRKITSVVISVYFFSFTIGEKH